MGCPIFWAAFTSGTTNVKVQKALRIFTGSFSLEMHIIWPVRAGGARVTGDAKWDTVVEGGSHSPELLSPMTSADTVYKGEAGYGYALWFVLWIICLDLENESLSCLYKASTKFCLWKKGNTV